MTQAYMEGFCKAAEVYGVGPEELVKTAQLVQTVLKGTSKVTNNLQGALTKHFPVSRFPYTQKFVSGSRSPLQTTRQIARGIRTSPDTLNPAWATEEINNARIKDALRTVSDRASRVDSALKENFTHTFGQDLPRALTPMEKATLQRIVAADEARIQKFMDIARQRRLI